MDISLQFVIVCIVLFFLAVLITRAIFSIGAIVRNLKAQTKLLSHIAKKQGVDETEVNKIVEESKDW